MVEQIITLSLASMLQFGTPILISALGAVITENSGVVNLALEGLMRIGGFFAVVGSYFSGNPWIGLALGVGVGILMGFLHAYICVTWRGDQIIYGVAINVFALGGMTYLLELFFNTTGHSPSVPAFAQGVTISETAAFWILACGIFLAVFALTAFLRRKLKFKAGWLWLCLSTAISLIVAYFVARIDVLVEKPDAACDPVFSAVGGDVETAVRSCEEAVVQNVDVTHVRAAHSGVGVSPRGVAGLQPEHPAALRSCEEQGVVHRQRWDGQSGKPGVHRRPVRSGIR